MVCLPRPSDCSSCTFFPVQVLVALFSLNSKIQKKKKKKLCQHFPILKEEPGRGVTKITSEKRSTYNKKKRHLLDSHKNHNLSDLTIYLFFVSTFLAVGLCFLFSSVLPWGWYRAPHVRACVCFLIYPPADGEKP